MGEPGRRVNIPANMGSVVLGLSTGNAKFNSMNYRINLGISAFFCLALAAGAAPAKAAPKFTLCPHGGGMNCVVDGDTIWLDGTKIRVADIDAPETHPPHCPQEAQLGQAATLRLQALLNAGPITLRAIKRDTDRYGRKLRLLMRDGQSLGMALVREGLARPYQGGPRQPWCPAA